MFCHKCGHELKSYMNFCGKCGEPVPKNNQKPQSATQPQIAPHSQSAPKPAQLPAEIKASTADTSSLINNIKGLAKKHNIPYTAFVAPDIPMDKFLVAKKIFAKNVNYNDVILFMDTTLFGSAKAGLVVTATHIYGKSMGELMEIDISAAESIRVFNSFTVTITTKNFSFNRSTPCEAKYIVDLFNHIKYNEQITKANSKSQNNLKEQPAASTETLPETAPLSPLPEAENIADAPPTVYPSSIKEIATTKIIDTMQMHISSIGGSSAYTKDIPSEKLNNAVAFFGIGISKYDVIGLIDFTLFGSAKNGIIFTTDKMVLKNSHTLYNIEYKEMKSVELLGGLRKPSVCVYFDDGSSTTIKYEDLECYVTNQTRALYELLEFALSLVELHKIKLSIVKGNTFPDRLTAIVKKYQHTLAENNPVYIRGSIPYNKLSVAICTYAYNALSDQCYLYSDSTIFGGAKNGFLITMWGIYSRDIGTDVTIYFRDVSHTTADKRNLYLHLKNGTKIRISNTCFHEDVLKKLIDDILSFYQAYYDDPSLCDKDEDYDYHEMLTCSFSLEKKNVTFLKKQYELGNPYAGLELGQRYRKGTKVKKDIQKALEYFQNIQSPLSYRYMGEIYYNGEDVKIDTALAETHFKKAVELGDLDSDVCLANMYFLGINHSVNYEKAFSNYKRLADDTPFDKLPHSLRCNLGICYYFGYGCNRDSIKAEHWLDSVKEDEQYAKYLLACLYVDNSTYRHKSKQGVKYLKELCKEKYPQALYKLGELYFLGIHLEEDEDQARKLIKEAYDLGQPEAYYYYGLIRLFDKKDEPDSQFAFECILKAAEEGYPNAQRDVAVMYQYGIGTKRDISLAKQWFDKARDNGDAYSADWYRHSLEFLYKVRVLNESCYEDYKQKPFDESKLMGSAQGGYKTRNAEWDSENPLERKGVHRIIYHYPECITAEKYNASKTARADADNSIGFDVWATRAYNTFNTSAVVHNFSRFTGKYGYGQAFEYANHVKDSLHFNNAKWIGSDNAASGADRVVNGINIQSKCPSSWTNFRNGCFDNGNFKYKGMTIEVPCDFYDSPENLSKIKAFEQEYDTKIVRSPYTTDQCKNISKCLNIDSLRIDMQLGLVTAMKATPMSFALSYAIAYFHGHDHKLACKHAVKSAGVTFVTTFTVTTITAQLSKSQWVQKLMTGSNPTNKLTKEVVGKAYKNTGVDLTKMKNPVKNTKNIIKANIVTNAVTTLVMETPDILRCINGRISKAQLLKNTGVTMSGVVGSSAGYVVGAACGSIIPVVGTFIGGLIGASLAGSFASKVATVTLDAFIENDGDKMLEIFNTVFTKQAEQYFMCESEIDYVVIRLREEGILSNSGLQDIYQSDDRDSLCLTLLTPYIEEVCAVRPFVVVPDIGEIELSEDDFKEIFSEEEVSDDTEVS